MYLWRKSVTERWLESNEHWLSDFPPEHVAIISRSGFARFNLEITGSSILQGQSLRRQYGGSLVTLKRDWFRQFTKAQDREELRVGKRLLIVDGETRRAAPHDASRLVIPSGAAFGTGDHATTAMTLRMLERRSRRLAARWTIADLGTGSGILSLAAARFGASRIEAIDNDLVAVSTAKENARRNGIRGIAFAVQDVKKWRPRRKLDLIVANLFSELLIGVLPIVRRALKPDAQFIFSGVMRGEEARVVRAIRGSGLHLAEVRRRGKWIALAGEAPAGVDR